MYIRFFKRVFDIIASFAALLVLSPLLILLTLLGALFLHGNPFFLQPRPGKNEVIFQMIKFRSMTDCTDSSGKLLPDKERITEYGHFLRRTSLDELPELLNILKGDMSFVGPRPQLVRDLVFMSEKDRTRHSVRPGLTGLAQVSGRNALFWEEKFRLDLEYISDITFSRDMKIILRTAKLVLFGGESSDETEVTDDYGDYLLKNGKITEAEYAKRLAYSDDLLGV